MPDRQLPRRLLLLAGLSAAGVAAGCTNTPDRQALPEPSPVTGTPVTPSQTGSGPLSPLPQLREASEVGHGPRSSPTVALTFHGAGSSATARAVLGELRRAGAPATVLAVGSWLDTDRSMARLVLADGHELGNHSQHHLPMRSLSAAVTFREIAECAAGLKRLTGSPGRWFRASGTQATTARIRRAAAAAGYRQCLSYDVDSTDWQDPGPAAIVAAVTKAVRSGSVISLHLGHTGTVAAIPPLLEALAKRSLRPVTVSQLLS